MKIAIPTRDGSVDNHFGHCEYYIIVEINDEKEIVSSDTMASPEGCGCKSDIAIKMQQMGISLMLAGSIGQGAVNKLAASGIFVIRGCEGPVDQLLDKFLAGKLIDNQQVCDHHDCHHHHQDNEGGEEPQFKLIIE